MDQVNIVDFRNSVSDVVNRVAYTGERIVLERRGKGVAALVSMDDLALLEKMEDEYWGSEGRKAEAAAKRKHEKPIPLAHAQRTLGTSHRQRRKAG